MLIFLIKSFNNEMNNFSFVTSSILFIAHFEEAYNPRHIIQLRPPHQLQASKCIELLIFMFLKYTESFLENHLVEAL